MRVPRGVDACSFSPPELARRWRVSPDKVVGWIRSGELAAFNVAARPGGRPRWRVSPEAMAAFEAARSATPLSCTSRNWNSPVAGLAQP